MELPIRALRLDDAAAGKAKGAVYRYRDASKISASGLCKIVCKPGNVSTNRQPRRFVTQCL